jgi:hypothetical protein
MRYSVIAFSILWFRSLSTNSRNGRQKDEFKKSKRRVRPTHHFAGIITNDGAKDAPDNRTVDNVFSKWAKDAPYVRLPFAEGKIYFSSTNTPSTNRKVLSIRCANVGSWVTKTKLVPTTSFKSNMRS